MTGATVTIVPGLEGLDALHARELPQKDNLCGCFWAAIALRAAGVEEVDGEPVDQDLVAVEAGTFLPDGDPATFVPPGASSRQDYRVALPLATDPAEGGTSAPALARAIERLGAAKLAVVPIAGPWSDESVVELLDVAATAAPGAFLVANIRTGALWSSRPRATMLVDYLAGRDLDPPPPEWDVGHFVNPMALVRGAIGTLVMLRDTYPSLGWNGYHLQPSDAFARALARGDGREGGVLCIAPAAEAAILRDRLAGAGYDLRHWDNGTPASVSES